jgi:hypothetical protein
MNSLFNLRGTEINVDPKPGYGRKADVLAPSFSGSTAADADQ